MPVEGPLSLTDFDRMIEHVDFNRGGPFFGSEWRYALHMSPAFPAAAGGESQPQQQDKDRRRREPVTVYPRPPAGQTPENTPANFHFNDVDQVFMRSDWGPDAFRARLWAGSVFGKSGSAVAKRYNWAHCRTNAGSFVLSRGEHEIILEPGRTRTYRKAGASNNCILINHTDQWGGGQVWHPRLEPDQISRIAMFADGQLLSVARADLVNAYPPQSGAEAVSRCLLHVKPDLFLLFDRVDAKGADGGAAARAEWRFHAAFIEPQKPGIRFSLFGFEATATRAMKDRSTSYGEAFKKNGDVSCQVAFLTPGVKANLGMTDTYFRWSSFQRPQRHLQVVKRGESPLTMLTAFAAKLVVESKSNVQVAAHHDGGHGKHSATEPLTDDQDIGLHVDVLATEHFSSASQAGGDFVQYQQCPVSVATFAHALPEPLRGGTTVVALIVSATTAAMSPSFSST